MPIFYSLLGWFSAPIILILSLPLAFFAAVTTTLAYWFLLFRVLLVYGDMALELLQSWLAPSSTASTPRSASRLARDRAESIKRSSRSSSVSSELYIHDHGKSKSFSGLTASIPNRDFEGVGGWRMSSNDEEESLWMGINSRLELPPPPIRPMRASFTIGSQLSSGFVSPELVRTPLLTRASGASARGGTASPESYFNIPLSGSMTALSTIDKSSKVSSDGRRRSGSSSTISLASVREMTKHEAP